jgi:xanthine dehydrogenase accessory factor
MMNEYKAEGIDGAWLSSIHSPIGLNIKSETPEEIAVSIAAEIIRVKNIADS